MHWELISYVKLMIHVRLVQGPVPWAGFGVNLSEHVVLCKHTAGQKGTTQHVMKHLFSEYAYTTQCCVL